MRNKVLLTILLSCFLLQGFAQADNYALRFTNNGVVNCGDISELKGISTFTMESWVNIANWREGAEIVRFGSVAEHSISITLGVENTKEVLIGVSNGENKVSAFSNTAFAKNEWHLLTVVYQGASDPQLTVYVDAQPVAVNNAFALPVTTSTQGDIFTIGRNFEGRIDEIRIWKKALTQSDILLKSTVSPFHHSYSELIAYWKCDQFTSPGLVDYGSGEHHGALVHVTREKVTDNVDFRYRPITSYLSLNAIAQGYLYEKEQLMTCNDLAILNCLQIDGSTGEVSFSYQDYPGKLVNVDFASSFTAPETPSGAYATVVRPIEFSRVTRNNGVLHFKGDGARFNLSGLGFGNTSTFQTWFYVNTWKEGTALFEKKATNGDEISLKMGASDGEFIFTVSGEVEGTRYTEVYPFDTYFLAGGEPANKLVLQTTGEFQYWHYLNLTFTSTTKGIPVSLAFDPFIQSSPILVTISDPSKITQNGTPIAYKEGVLERKIVTLPHVDGDMLIGKDLDGYMDEIAFWGSNRSTSQRCTDDALDVGLRFGERGVYYTIQTLWAYYRVMDPNKPMRNEMCFENLLGRVLELLKGHRGYKIRMSVMGSWAQLMGLNPEGDAMRAKVAKNLVKAIHECPFYKFDGLDFDFEWPDLSQQEGYGLFVEQVRKEIGNDGIVSVASNSGDGRWYSFTKKTIENVDYFTSQDYGPHRTKFTYDNFLQTFRQYRAYGDGLIDKMMLSYGAYGVGEYMEFDSTPYRNFGGGITDSDIDRIPKNETSWFNFCGINQTRKRTQHVLDKNLAGIMYYDVICDLSPKEPNSLTRSMSQALASNNEPIVEVQSPPSLISSIVSESTLQLTPSPIRSGEILTISGTTANEIRVYDLTGRLVLNKTLSKENINEVQISLSSGMYVAKVGHSSKQLMVID